LADGWEAELIGIPRSRLAWVSRRKVPAELQRVVSTLGLTVEAVGDLEQFNVSAADLFAVIVSAVGKDVGNARSKLLRLLKTMHVLDYGVLLGTAAPKLNDALTLQSDLLGITNLQIAALDLTSNYLAGSLRSHSAGPAANTDLELSGHTINAGVDVDDHESDAILIRRAFNGFTKLNLTSLEGGHSSDSRVWWIEAHSDADRCEPFVAKAGRRPDLVAEFETYCTFVRESVPFPFRAPLLEARFVKGATRALLVSAFVGRSQRLDDYLAAAPSPELVMVSLFEGALGRWRRGAASRSEYALGHFYVEQQKAAAERQQRATGPSAANVMAISLLPDPKGLDAAFQKARETDNKLLTPSELWDRLTRLNVKGRYICRVHGDLNVRNVFVRWNSIDTIMIDFSHSGIKESLARDPAKLDTSISLTARKGEELLSESVLRQLYQGRLLPPRNFVVYDGRTEAIRQIRRHAGGEGISSDEYEILIICHLLRFACEPLNRKRDTVEMQSRRPLCYALACGLLMNI
jgi:hypothetical protein